MFEKMMNHSSLKEVKTNLNRTNTASYRELWGKEVKYID
jgi:hypothetical protein